MKSKQEIYNNTVELIEKQEKENYLAYYKVFLDNSKRHDIPTEEIEKIILLSSGFECSIAFFMNLSMMGEILL